MRLGYSVLNVNKGNAKFRRSPKAVQSYHAIHVAPLFVHDSSHGIDAGGLPLSCPMAVPVYAKIFGEPQKQRLEFISPQIRILPERCLPDLWDGELCIPIWPSHCSSTKTSFQESYSRPRFSSWILTDIASLQHTAQRGDHRHHFSQMFPLLLQSQSSNSRQNRCYLEYHDKRRGARAT